MHLTTGLHTLYSICDMILNGDAAPGSLANHTRYRAHSATLKDMSHRKLTRNDIPKAAPLCRPDVRSQAAYR